MAGRRFSHQREMIYQAVRESKEHPTAEMVYQQLKPKAPNLSLGTVYRNLSLLSEEGVLVRMPFPVERYDAETAPHAHFRCKGCGRVFDMMGEYDKDLDQAAARKVAGFRVESHDLTFTGLCPQCLDEEAAG